MPHAAVGQTLLAVLCLGQSSCEPCFASQTRRSCRPALQAWCALRSICLRGSVSDDNWQPPYVPYVHKRRQIRGRLSGLSCETNTGAFSFQGVDVPHVPLTIMQAEAASRRAVGGFCCK